MREWSKKKKITVATVVGVFLLAVIILVLSLFAPLLGKKHVDIWTPAQPFDLDKDTFVMQKEAGEDFRILQLTDIQLFVDEKDNKQAFKIAEDTIAKAYREGGIDLVVLTGDLVSGICIPIKLKRLISFMEDMAVKYDFYWAPVFGNHDNEVKATPNWSADQYLKASVDEGGRCLFRKGPSNLGDDRGKVCGNYVITVKEGDEIVQALYMLDNSSYTEYTDEDRELAGGRNNRERPITTMQIAWYKWNQENINKLAGKTVPNMAYTHFAPYDAGIAFESYFAGPDGIFGNDDDKIAEDGRYYLSKEEVTIKDSEGRDVIFKGITGSYSYRPSTSLITYGFTDVAKGLGLNGYFFGHDHECDGVLEYDGVIYGFGLKTGPSPKPWNDANEFGGTLITFDSGDDIAVEHLIMQQASDWWGE